MKTPILHRARHVVRNYFLHIICGSLVLIAGTLLVRSDIKAAGSILFLDSFGYADGLITNEYAHWNASSGSAHNNANWDMTSGSLFEQGGSAWSGVPNDSEPDATSSSGNNSSVFRLNTKRFDFGDVYVSFRLKLDSLGTSASTPAVDWDGIHIFLRYQSEYNLYYASVNRRDGRVVIKKKCAGGSTNGGTYYELSPGEIAGHPIPYGSWQNVAASVANNTDGSVTLRIYREGVLIVTAIDTGTGCAPIRSAGATGIRGDNANFHFDDFQVQSLASVATPQPTATPPPAAGPKPAPGSTPKASSDSSRVASASTEANAEPTTSAAPSVSPSPKGAAKPGKPGLLDPTVLTKAARTQPTFLAGLLAALLSIVLAALLIHDHHHVRRTKKRPRR